MSRVLIVPIVLHWLEVEPIGSRVGETAIYFTYLANGYLPHFYHFGMDKVRVDFIEKYKNNDKKNLKIIAFFFFSQNVLFYCAGLQLTVCVHNKVCSRPGQRIVVDYCNHRK